MQDNAGPLLDRVDLWGGIALGPLEIAGTRNGAPHVIADQLSRVANPADARLGAQAVARIQVLNVDPVLTAHVVFGRQARGEDHREVGALPGGRVAVAGQMRACLKAGLRMHAEHAGQILPVGIARKRTTTTTTSVADRPFPGQGRVLTPRRPCPRIRVERPGQGYPTRVSPGLRGPRTCRVESHPVPPLITAAQLNIRWIFRQAHWDPHPGSQHFLQTRSAEPRSATATAG